VPKNDRALITKALDLGAQGVVVPHISNKEDAARAVEACKYGPTGRSACPLARSADYGIANWQEYQETANRETMVFLLIEDLEGAKNIEDILTVKGIDVVFIGPFDMSVSAGYKGNVGHPEILKNLDRVITVCNERGIPVMHTLACGPDLDAWVKKGVRLILQGADSMIFTRACRNFLESVSHLRRRK
jgi:2-keto-3-deoxy-L-rhamnonate aldolase RhmA